MNRVFIVLDQVLYSLTTFLVAVIAARNLSIDAYGAFGLAFAISVLALGVHRAMYTEPMLVFEGRGLPARALGARSVRGSFALGSILASVTAVAYFSAEGPLVAALAIFIVGPFIADACRFVLLSRDSGIRLFVFELAAISCQVLALTAVSALGATSWTTYLVAWSASTLVAPTAFFWAIREHIRRPPELNKAERAEVRRSSIAFGTDFLLGALSLQATLLTATFVAGLSAAAALRGADTLIGPFRVILQTLPAMFLKRWSRRGVVSRHVIVVRTALMLTPFIALGALALLLVPDPVGTQLLGETWSVARPILPIVLAALLPTTVTYLASLALKSAGAARLLVQMRALVVPITVGCGVTGAVLAGASGAASGSLIGSTIAASVYFIALVKREKSKGNTDDQS